MLRKLVPLAVATTAAAQSTGCRRSRSEVNDLSGQLYALQGETCAVHDPAIAVENGKLFVFSTDTGPQGNFNGNLLIRCGDASNTTFSACAEVFPNMDAIPWYKTYAPSATNIWAPDVSYFNGSWHMYYAVSEFGKMNSVIGLATAPVLDPSNPQYSGWSDQGAVLSTDGSQDYNAIDPSVILEHSTGTPYMVFGSFWKGIQLVRLNSTTGKVDPSFPVTTVAQRTTTGDDAIEGAFIVYRSATGSVPGYYYLFISWNYCCKGAASNYEVRMGRSSSITGPYLDEAGVSLLQGGGTHILGYPTTTGWAAAGGESILRETVDSAVTAMVVHAYDGVTGDPWLNLVGLQWDAQTGWPTMVPWP